MRDRFESAPTFEEYLASVVSNRRLWDEIYGRAVVPPEILELARGLHDEWHLLVLSEDWCGDCVSVLPYLARLTEAVSSLDLRVLSRDENPDLMAGYLTSGSRSIPVVIILDGEFQEVGWWGPRPSPLQDLFFREILALPKPERFPRIRAWYARDKGRTTLRELLEEIPGLSVHTPFARGGFHPIQESD